MTSWDRFWARIYTPTVLINTALMPINLLLEHPGWAAINGAVALFMLRAYG